MPQCERACAGGTKPCEAQESQLGCDMLYFRCAGSCPWSLTDPTTAETFENTDAFRKCEDACGAGRQACLAVRDKLPPRKRTGTFDACAEAQGACYAMGMSVAVPASSFPDDCAKACFTGLAPCQAATTPAMKCGEYYYRCAEACPNVHPDELEGDPVADTPEGDACLKSCDFGQKFCRALVGSPEAH